MVWGDHIKFFFSWVPRNVPQKELVTNHTKVGDSWLLCPFSLFLYSRKIARENLILLSNYRFSQILSAWESLKNKISDLIVSLIYSFFFFLSHIQSIYQSIYLRGAYDKFPDFFRIGTFIDSKHMKL